MRKTAMFVGMVALMIALCAPVALAATHQCSGRPCTGTNSANTLYERPGNGVPDAIYGRAGRDDLRADAHTRDTDRLYGNRGSDLLTVNDGDARDAIYGGPGFDVCIGDTRAEIGGGCERVRLNAVPPPPGGIEN